MSVIILPFCRPYVVMWSGYKKSLSSGLLLESVDMIGLLGTAENICAFHSTWVELLSIKSQRPRCPVGEGEICPPWGDTPKARLLNCIGFQRGICWIPPVYKSNRREGSICISAFSYRLLTNGEKRSAFVGSDFPNWVKLILDWPRLPGLLQWHGPACQSWQGFHQICLFSAALDTWSDSYPNLSCLRWSESARTISRKSCTLCTFPFTHFLSFPPLPLEC